jgi:hypothetical protein
MWGKMANQGERIRLPGGRVGKIEETMEAGVFRVRVLTQFERWRDDGQITDEQLRAAEQFNRDFQAAGKGPNYAVMSIARVDGGGRGEAHEWMATAAKRVSEALEAVGEISCPVVCAVIGEEKTIREYCRISTWAGRPMNQHFAKGLLFSALDSLERFYKVGPHKPGWGCKAPINRGGGSPPHPGG